MGIRGTALNGTSTSTSPLTSPATIMTPLLMPPPTTRLEQIRHYGMLTWYRATYWMHHNAASSTLFLRLLLLGAKLFSLSWYCWPYSSNLGVLSSVFTLAALDLWNPSSTEASGVLGLRSSRDMIIAAASYEGANPGTSHWLWGWRRSCTLLVLHFLVLWVTSRAGLLCAAERPDRWAEW